MSRKTLKPKDYGIPTGPTSKPSDKPKAKRKNMYDLGDDNRQTMRNLRAAARGQGGKRKK